MKLENILKNKLCRSILIFFHENQSAIDTPRGIATWVKAERPIVKKALDMLVELGILIEHKSSSTTAYSYTRNKKTIREIDKKLKNDTSS